MKNLLVKIYGALFVISLIIMFALYEVTLPIFWYVAGNSTMWIIFVVIIAIVYFLKRYFSQEITNKEAILTILAVLPTLIINSVTLFSVSTNLIDYELMNTAVQKIVYIESYYTPTEHTEEDEDGNVIKKWETCDHYHGPQWYIITQTGKQIDISQKQYRNIKKKLATQQKTVAYRQPFQCSSFDGRQYEVTWNQSATTRIPVSYRHRYINYVKATHSLYRLEGQGNGSSILPYYDILTNKFGPIDAERIRIDDKHIGIPRTWQTNVTSQTNHALTQLGSKKQCNIGYYFTSKPRSQYHLLNQEWCHGKKNDIIIVIGMTTWPQIKWVKIMSTNKNETLDFNIKLRNSILSNGLMDETRFVNDVVNYIDQYYEREPMANKKYLLQQVKMSWPAWIAVILIVCLITAPLVIEFIGNEYKN